MQPIQLSLFCLQLFQALNTTDYGLHDKFANKMLVDEDEDFLDHVFLNDELTFNFNGKVQIWGSENPHRILQCI